MIDVKNGLVPHITDINPYYRNKYSETVAVLLARNGIIPQKEWMYDNEYEYD